MTNHWILWQGSDADHWQWCLPGADGRLECPVQSGSLATAANMIGDQNTNLLLRGEYLLLTTTSINARHRKQVMAALPFHLEEQLATPPEQLHLASRASANKGEYQVAIINRQRLNDLLQRLSQSGIGLTGVFADPQALPVLETGMTMLIDKGRVLARSANGTGFAASAAAVGPLWALIANQDNSAVEPTNTTLYATDDVDPNLMRSLKLDKEQCRAITQPLELLASGLNPDQSINLLQGDFKSYLRKKRALKIPRLTLMLLLVLLTVQAAVFWQGNRHLENELISAELHLSQTHKRQFGVDVPTENFRQAVLNRLTESVPRADERRYANFIERLSRIIHQMPSRLTLEQIDYSPSSLKLMIRSPDLATAEIFQQNLRSTQITAEIAITDRQKDQVWLTLTVDES